MVGRHGDGWKLRVSAPPQDGRANDATVRLLADTLNLPARDVEIVAGHTSRDKVASVTGLDVVDVETRLARAARPTNLEPRKDPT